MTDAIAHLTPQHALKLVAQHGGKDKTPAGLRLEAEEFEREAFRADRVFAAGSTRRKARQLARARKGEQHRANANVAIAAAAEVERRRCSTVGEALKPAPIRWLRRIAGKR